jgi:4-hydroxy-tetrahydrodipicolinate reductase
MPPRSQSQVRIGVVGAGGRMGGAVIEAIGAHPAARLAGAVEHADHGCVGRPLGDGLVIGANPLALAHASDALIDFTTPEALAESLGAAEAAGKAIVIGTTGLGPTHQRALDRAARSIAVLWSANMSVGVALLAELAEVAARKLAAWDAEILDLHHADKLDAPSGTALMLAEAVARGKGAKPTPPRDRFAARSRRPDGEIGFASLRGGTAAGDHRLFLLGPGERIELAHVAEDRGVFARGAVAAAVWLARQPPGRYALTDMLAAR